MTNKIVGAKLEEVARLRREKEAAEGIAEQAKAAYKKAGDELLKILEAEEIDKISAHGFSFSIVEQSSVKVPKEIEAKKEFFKFLRDRDLFWSHVSINSQTLNSLYKTLEKEAIKNGQLEFSVPGLEAPSTYKELRMRKA